MKKHKSRFKPLRCTPLVLLAFLAGCSGGNPEYTPLPNSGPTITGTGRFIDGPVEGLSYLSGSLTGTTNANGEFTYVTGMAITFSYAGITLGQAIGGEILTPRNLVQFDDNADKLINLLRFLQTMDTDGNHDNGIQLPDLSGTVISVRNINFNQSQVDFELDSDLKRFLQESANKGTLINADDALKNFEKATAGNQVHPLEGQTLYRYENGSGSRQHEALWCDTWRFENGKVYANNRTLTNLSTCTDVDKTAEIASYSVQGNNLVWTFTAAVGGGSETMNLQTTTDPYQYYFSGTTADDDQNRIYRSKAQVEALLATSTFEANGDRMDVTLTEISAGSFKLSAVFPSQSCSTLSGRYNKPAFTDSLDHYYGAYTGFIQNGADCEVYTNISNPTDGTRYFVVAQSKAGLHLENLKAGITYHAEPSVGSTYTLELAGTTWHGTTNTIDVYYKDQSNNWVFSKTCGSNGGTGIYFDETYYADHVEGEVSDYYDTNSCSLSGSPETFNVPYDKNALCPQHLCSYSDLNYVGTETYDSEDSRYEQLSKYHVVDSDTVSVTKTITYPAQNYRAVHKSTWTKTN